MTHVFVFNYGRKDAGYEVPAGTEFIARSLRLRNGRSEVVEERRRVFGNEYGFGSAETFEEVTPAGAGPIRHGASHEKCSSLPQSSRPQS